jgi:hypothetical protein
MSRRLKILAGTLLWGAATYGVLQIENIPLPPRLEHSLCGIAGFG